MNFYKAPSMVSNVIYESYNQYDTSGYSSINTSFNSPMQNSFYSPYAYPSNKPVTNAQTSLKYLNDSTNQMQSLTAATKQSVASNEPIQRTKSQKRSRAVANENTPITSKRQKINTNSEFKDYSNEFPIEHEYDENDLENDFSLESSSLMLQNGDKKKRVLNGEQRNAANKRERKRMNIMNDAFVNLRHKLPISTGRKRRKMSRLDIVLGAMEYIALLESMLNSDKPIDLQEGIYNIKYDNFF
jgi:hypothetical protein